MKKVLTITALLFSVSIFGQDGKFKIYTPKSENYLSGKFIFGKTSDYAIPIEKLVVKESKPITFVFNEDSISVSNFYWLTIIPKAGKKTKYYQISIPEVLSVSGNVDTLEIKSKDIKFIKVDGKIYEINRTTELKEVVDNYGYKGRIYSPYPSTIYYDGMGLAAPAILPLIDTLSRFYVNPKMK